jgi:flagellar hook-associated protein 1
MGDLISSLSLAARALSAEQAGLDVTGQNIANVNTPGYTRRTIEFAEIPPVDTFSAGNGVSVVAIRAQRDALLDAQVLHEQPSESREAAVAQSLSQVESVLGSAGSSLDEDLSKFFSAFSQLAGDPMSSVARQQVVLQAQSLATSFGDVAARLSSAQRDADAQVRSGIEQINTLAGQIASANAAMPGASATGKEALRDQLNSALGALSQIIDISVITRADGGSDVSIGNGRALVIGANTYSVGVAPMADSGFAGLTSGGAVITTEVTGGRIGGFLQVRDVLLPGYTSQLDQLANGVATAVNAAHRAGFDLNGTAGGDFFVPPAAVAGSASSLAVSANIVATPSLIAAAGAPAPGDNTNARAIANLATTPLPGKSANPIDAWAALVYRVGTDASTATSNQASRSDVLKQLQSLRDQVSGVSLDEEGANLIKFQRAYEANARYFSAVQASIDTLLTALGG